MEEMKKYRGLNRSSDLDVKINGKTQSELFANSAFALFDLMTDLSKVQCEEQLPLDVEGIDGDDLFLNWMRELLYLYEGSSYLIKEVVVNEAHETRVRGEVRCEKYDPDRHEIKQEFRSVLPDKCRMEKTGTQWMAQFILEV